MPTPEEKQEMLELAFKATLQALRGKEPDVTSQWVSLAVRLCKDETRQDDESPVQSAIRRLEAARKAGGRMPPLSNDDDPATA